MIRFGRRAFLLSSLAAPAVAGAMTLEQRNALDLSGFRVNDPLAGYFDLPQRRDLMKTTTDPVLSDLRERLMLGKSCRDAQSLPIIDQRIRLPPFYESNTAWREAVRPFFALEDAVSGLAAANLVSDDRYHADCLVDLLSTWSEHRALTDFHYSGDGQQGWFQLESTLFAVALALAAVRTDVTSRSEELARIDTWLGEIARAHYAIPGQSGGTCCNNHFYRRALYATIIGVMTGADDLFRVGVSAIYSAVADATPEGALPLEMKRGALAAHYQNFALMYLALIAEIIERQGYPIWRMEIDGRTLNTLVDFNNRLLANPEVVLPFSGSDRVTEKYREDPQYFAWFETYLARFRNPQMEAWIGPMRPLYNRSLGGHLTGYFYTPA